jgi:hypothetical protein
VGGGAEVFNLEKISKEFTGIDKNLVERLSGYGIDFRVAVKRMVRPDLSPVECIGVSPPFSWKRTEIDLEHCFDISLFKSASKTLGKLFNKQMLKQKRSATQ